MYRLFWILAASICCVYAQEERVDEIRPQDIEVQGPSVQEFYSYMQEAMDDEDWWSAVDYGEIVLYNFPTSPFVQDVSYFVGKAYFHLNQYELANAALGDYLKQASNLKYFQEVVEMKFSIAEFYREGGKKRLFGSQKLPAWMPAQEDAVAIYDEIIALIPHHEMGIRALLGKAEMQAEIEQYKASIETLQLLIRRFPKHELAAEGYLQINNVYLAQCQDQQPDTNLLDLALVNYQKFEQAFPREPRLEQAMSAIDGMKEIYAQNLFETGSFYLRRKQKDASALYFSKVLAKFPQTKTAIAAQEQLEKMRPATEEEPGSEF